MNKHDTPNTDVPVTCKGDGDSEKRQWITAGHIGLRLAVFSPLITFVVLLAFSGVSPRSSPAVRNAILILIPLAILSGLIGSLFSFRALVSRNTSPPYSNWKERRLGIIGLCIFCLNLIIPLSPAVMGRSIAQFMKPVRRDAHRDPTVQNFRALYKDFTDFAEDRPDKSFPVLSREPGKLMHDNGKLPAGPSRAYYIAKNDPDYKRPNGAHGSTTNGKADVDDWSYFYLGYEIHSEAEMEAFAQMYRQAYSAGKWLEGDLTMASDASDNGARVIPQMNMRIPAMPPDAKRPPLPGIRGATIPVCIERIENNQNKGGHVLFLDGHVEFMDYPGHWPMTEKTIALLNEMERMGTKAGGQ